MRELYILDCTLRDGGYVNQWEFGEEVIWKILTRLTEGNIEIIECGFLSDGAWSHDVAKFSSTELPVLLDNRPKTNILYVGMIALGEKELHYSRIPKRSEKTLDGIRITFHRDKFEVNRAIDFARELMAKGYLVFMQPIGTMFYSDLELLNLIVQMNELSPYAFYIVDTLGSMNSQMLLHLFYLIDHNMKGNIKVGFHGHNNLQLAFSNARSLIDLHTNRNIILDSSVFGMGRGAGNLCTELIADYLNATQKKQYDCTKFFSIIDTCLLPIKSKFDWGYSAPYYLAAIKNCHPNYVSYLLTKGTLLSVDIDQILTLIPKEESYLYDQNLIQSLYLEYQRHQIDDTAIKVSLSKKFSNKTVMLIAPGISITAQKQHILSRLSNTDIVSISINFAEIFVTDYVFISNKKRFQYLKDIQTSIIVTSNLDYDNVPCDVVNYSSLLNQSTISYDNAGLMAIDLMIQLGVTRILLAGFDGFTHGENHFDHSKLKITKIYDAEERNQDMKNILLQYGKLSELSFITDTHYKNLEGINYEV